jgi:hypothetical protein
MNSVTVISAQIGTHIVHTAPQKSSKFLAGGGWRGAGDRPEFAETISVEPLVKTFFTAQKKTDEWRTVAD